MCHSNWAGDQTAFSSYLQYVAGLHWSVKAFRIGICSVPNLFSVTSLTILYQIYHLTAHVLLLTSRGSQTHCVLCCTQRHLQLFWAHVHVVHWCHLLFILWGAINWLFHLQGCHGCLLLEYHRPCVFLSRLLGLWKSFFPNPPSLLSSTSRCGRKGFC